jgi:hypothetical protein
MWFEGKDQIDAHFLARVPFDLRAVHWSVRTAKVSVLTRMVQGRQHTEDISQESHIVATSLSWLSGRTA